MQHLVNGIGDCSNFILGFEYLNQGLRDVSDCNVYLVYIFYTTALGVPGNVYYRSVTISSPKLFVTKLIIAFRALVENILLGIGRKAVSYHSY